MRHAAIVAMFDQHQFGRPAANVEHQRRSRPRFDQDVATQHRKPRFFTRGNDVERDAGFAANPFDEFLSVAGPAACFGGHGTRQCHAATAQFIAANAQGAQRALHRRIRQAPGLRQSFAKAHDPAERIDHDKAVARRPRDQQAAIVGAKVDRCIGLAIGAGK
jgi:hypothetical protein